MNIHLSNRNEKHVKLCIKAILVFPISLLLLALFFGDYKNIPIGLLRIITHPSMLLTDYIAVGGIGATFFNSALLTIINIYLVRKLKITLTGPIISAFFIIAGFAFFGKNIFNVWPIYIGGYLYAKYQKKKFKNVLLISMFGTSLAPLVSMVAFGFDLPIYIGILLGYAVGIFVGFILPPISSHMLKVHDGYNLANIGFASGFIGTVIIAIFRSYNLQVEATMILSSEYDLILMAMLTLYSLLLIFIGYYMNRNVFSDYKKIFKYTGRLITDFTHLTGFDITLVNMGIMGLISILFIILTKGKINGPIVAGVLTVIGFSSFGIQPKNSIPIILGVYLSSLTKIWEIDSTVVIIAGLFGTFLSPIAGVFGWALGFVSGFIHLSVVMNIGFLHGGINLYNNGFSTGIVATIMISVIDALKKED